MTKYFFILVLVTVPVLLTAQVFSTGEILRQGKSSVGINSYFPFEEENKKVYLFVHMGHGIGQACDIDAKVGFAGNETYFGADVEWQLTRRDVYVTFTGGVHKFSNFGMDAILNVMLPMDRNGGVNLGADLDVEFNEKETSTPFWLFIGMKMNLNRMTGFLVTLEGAMNKTASSILSAGLKFGL